MPEDACNCEPDDPDIRKRVLILARQILYISKDKTSEIRNQFGVSIQSIYNWLNNPETRISKKGLKRLICSRGFMSLCIHNRAFATRHYIQRLAMPFRNNPEFSELAKIAVVSTDMVEVHKLASIIRDDAKKI